MENTKKTAGETAKRQINKQIAKAFGKKTYLLGCDADGIYYWLESPSWDCDWYWGFGYVKTYTNNKHPELSRDINSHRHIDNSFRGKIDGCTEYIYNIYDAPLLSGGTTFTKKEGWELSELFSQFYTLRKAADFFHSGKSNISSTICTHDKEECKRIYDYINQTMMPKIFKRIKEILTPNEKED